MVDKAIKECFVEAMQEDAAKKITDDDWLSFERVSIETLKLKSGTNVPKVTIPEPGGPFRDALRSARFPEGIKLRRAHITVDKAVLQRFFDESLTHIADHTRWLLHHVQGIHCIMLAGGYAECPFLYDRLHAEFNTEERQVIRPSRDAGLAIVKGAVIFGQNLGIIKKRVARYTYGLGTSVLFVEGKHSPNKKFQCDSGVYCEKVFETLVTVDEPVEIGKTIEDYYGPNSANWKQMTVRIYRSSKRKVNYTDEDGCELLATVQVPMGNPEKGLDREVLVKVTFGETQLQCTAIDGESGKKKIRDIPIDYTGFEPTDL